MVRLDIEALDEAVRDVPGRRRRRVELMHRAAVVREDPACEAGRVAGATPGGVPDAVRDGDLRGRTAGAGIADDLPVTGRCAARGVPALVLVVPDELA